ncbi:MAG: SDR family oxidoreductase [Bacteroidota bacterium]
MFTNDILKDQVALVTGGGTGIGLAIAKSFLAGGARVFIASRKQEKLDRALEELKPMGEVYGHTCDIRELTSIAALADFIRQKAGRLDILINNAGGQFPSLAADMSHKGWNAVINNNLNGTWNMTREFYDHFFKDQQSGVIVNIIVMIHRGFPGMAHTGAARAGVDNLTKSLAVEWGRQGIRINAVAPGIIDSSGLAQYPAALKQGLAEKIPQGRLGTTEEVANLVTFLASPGASYITGDTIYIDGGMKLWGSIFQL